MGLVRDVLKGASGVGREGGGRCRAGDGAGDAGDC